MKLLLHPASAREGLVMTSVRMVEVVMFKLGIMHNCIVSCGWLVLNCHLQFWGKI